MALRALIWDVDGTLAETERDGHLPAFNAAFEAAGVPWRWSAERYGELLGVTGGYERLLHDMQTQPEAPKSQAEREALARRLHLDKNARYAQIVAAGGIPLREGVRELMDDCREAGVAMAIATTTSRSNVDALLGAHLGLGWQAWFACVLCGEDAARKKPDPLVYTLALERLRTGAREVLAIEDSPVGVRACVGAGVPVVVSRSVYFAEAVHPEAVAAGPGLGQRAGWSREARPPVRGRIDLDVLRGWFEAP
jgi:HAD superfamily hydrolase (TIGR01509 family)